MDEYKAKAGARLRGVARAHNIDEKVIDRLVLSQNEDLDNLLVEVEGWIPGEENGSDPDTVPPNELNWNNGFAYGVNETRYKLLQALTRFRGEEKV